MSAAALLLPVLYVVVCTGDAFRGCSVRVPARCSALDMVSTT